VSLFSPVEGTVHQSRPVNAGDMRGNRAQDNSDSGLGGLIAAAILLSPVLAFLMALVVDIVIGFLNDGSVPALLVLVAAGAIGGVPLPKAADAPAR
jgi:hypothetical protein